MRRGTKPGFWKSYNRQQFSMLASCMPTLAANEGAKPMKIQAPLAVCTPPSRRRPETPFEILGIDESTPAVSVWN
jgi:hypothetical protein